MTRTAKNKLLYVMALILAVAVFLVAYVYGYLGPVDVILVGILLIIPGRIGAYVLRDLFLARRYVDAHRYDDAIAVSERFLQTLDRQPWRRHFIYCCSFAVYSWNARAMALNNLGVAEMELGRLDSAETHLEEALSFDEAFPIPYYNLAVVAGVRDDDERSEQMMTAARQLGFSRNRIDQALDRVGSAYARIQSIPN